jgi:HlyD family secretion protein
VNKSTVFIGMLLLVAVAAGLGFFWPFGNGKVLTLPGIVEIQEVRLGSKIGGRVAKLSVAEGQIVSRGQKLLELEAPELASQRDQQKARVQQAQADLERIMNGPREEEKRAAQAAADAAKARYDKMMEGWREEEKRQVQSEWETADADLKQAMEDLARVADLYRTKSLARADYDAALATRDRARGRANTAKAKLDMYRLGNRKEDKDEARAEWQKAQANADLTYNGSREEDKALARAKLAETQAKLDEIETNLKEAVVNVPDAPQFGKAVVEVLAVRPGDLVQPGQPVVRMLCAEDLWVKIFVPETKLGLITLHQDAEVTMDSYPGKVFQGRVIQRASISEFTPRNVQSVDERRHQVFGVKIRVEDPQGVFSAGMAAEVKFRLD